MQRFYLVPVDQQGMYRGPLYLKWRFNPTGIDTRWGWLDYGGWNIGIVLCSDISVADDAALTAHVDATAFPVNLDQPITDAAFKTRLEAVNIPTDWATASTTYREMLRMLAGIFQFTLRFNVLSGGLILFDSGVTLETNFRSVPQAKESAFNQTLAFYGLPAVSGNPKLRALTKQVGDLWATKTFILCDVEF